VAAGARTIEAQPLERYWGEALVVHAPCPRGTRLTLTALEAAIGSLTRLPPRVLIATGTFPNPDHWNNDFAALEPAIVDALADRGVVLIGLDTPSVDLIDSKDLPTHHRFLARDVAILEGLVLAGVPAGVYELSALPLKLAGFDASPVRAVLRTL
jgi:arylformamidase